MNTLAEDLGHALRVLRRSPGFTAVAAVTIALGIGPTTTIFSVANALLHRTPDGVRDPAELISVYCSGERFRWGTCSYPVFRDYRDADNELAAVAAIEGFSASLSVHTAEEPEAAVGLATSSSYFALLGTRAAHGRLFLPQEDDAPNANAVVVLSHRTWRQRFGGDPGIVGSTVNLNRTSFTVIGVAEEGFDGHVAAYDVGLWVPIGMREAMLGRDLSDSSTGIVTIGRRHPDWSVARVAQAAAVLTPRLSAEHLSLEEHALTVVPYSVMFDEAKGPVTLIMALLLVVTGIVLLIASVNVSSVMLTRAVGRSREIAVRLALGSGRWRLVRQLLAESVVVFLLGAGAGILIALWTTRGLAAIQLPVPVPMALEVPLDWRVLAFTLGLAFFAGALFGLAPALQATRQDLVSSLKAGPGGTGGRRGRLRNAFVVAQVSGSVVLLVAAGLFLRALGVVDSLDLGFAPDGVHVVTIDVSLHRYSDTESRSFFDRLVEQAAVLPDVRSAGVATMLPLGFGTASSMFTLPGREEVMGDGLRRAYFSVVSGGYFETLRIPIVAGRAFTAADREGAMPVMIVNQKAAGQFWPGESPLGQAILWGDAQYEVVGVSRDGRYASIREEPEPLVYMAFAQRVSHEASLVVRTDPGAPRVDRRLREIALELDPDLPVQTNAPYGQIIGLSLLPNRIVAGMALGFGLLGLLLASVGLFGVLSYAVSRRTHEIGIRIAMGADARDVRGLVLGQSARLVATGLVIGCVVAFVAAHAIRGLLFGLSPADPLPFGGIVLVLAVVGALASYLPARRAMRTDPVVALRQE